MFPEPLGQTKDLSMLQMNYSGVVSWTQPCLVLSLETDQTHLRRFHLVWFILNKLLGFLCLGRCVNEQNGPTKGLYDSRCSIYI